MCWGGGGGLCCGHNIYCKQIFDCHDRVIWSAASDPPWVLGLFRALLNLTDESSQVQGGQIYQNNPPRHAYSNLEERKKLTISEK